MPQCRAEPERVTVIDHPLVQHKLSLMRRHDTSTSKFRGLMREVSLLLGYEATRDLALEETEIETPLERGTVPILAGKKLCLVSILRAGNGILDGMLDLVPSARVGHIGLYRQPRTLEAVEYYLKLPEDLPERDVILVDPMLATGNSAVAAISRLVELRARSIKFVCLVAAPEGIAAGAPGLSRGRDRDRRDRPLPQRSRLYPARARRCRRPAVRDEVRGRAAGPPGYFRQLARSRASATNRARCSGDSVARKSSIRAVASRLTRSRSSKAASNERITSAVSIAGFPAASQAAR